MWDYTGKVVLITGGGGGTLGPAIAAVYAIAGASVVLCDKRPGKSAEKAATLQGNAQGTVIGYDVDIADRNAVAQMVDDAARRLGPIDILVGNAAEVVFEPFERHSMAIWDRIIEVDLTANYHLARLVLPAMVERGSGNLLFIGSVASWLHASDLMPGEFSYAVAKSGLVTLTRTLAVEFGPCGIRCNGIAPGLIESGFTRSHESFAAGIRERTPLRRLGAAKDITNAALFLTSDEAANFITGETLCISGGLHMRV
jgi:NAD(P)-dependent dehydrogenase (short-subunit alcohol dehydrogenase family)